MEALLQQFDRILVKNTLTEWLIALGVVVAIVLVVALAKRLVVRVLRRLAGHTRTHVDDAVLRAVQATRLWLVTVVALCFGSQYLELPRQVVFVFGKALTIALFLQAGLWIWALAEFWLARSRERALAENPAAATGLTAITFIARLLLWSVVLLMTLDNLGVNVTTMIAGLGVGGIAVALAVQNVLGDLFASMSIVIDKPFVIGDFVIVDEYMGTVEHVGLKTTRIRSLNGEQIIFANGDLLKTRIRNYKRMRERRAVFTFGVEYRTPVETIEKIPALVRSIVEARAKVRFERAHFKSFGDSSLDFEVVYWMLEPDFNLYMDTQQLINLELMRAFEKEKVGFAYPTQTMLFEGPLKIEREQAAEEAASEAAPSKSERKPRDSHSPSRVRHS